MDSITIGLEQGVGLSEVKPIDASGSPLNGGSAVELLMNWATERGLRLSPLLRELFAEAGRLVSELSPNSGVVSTTLLLFTIPMVHPAFIETGANERRALRKAADLLNRDEELLQAHFDQYFQKGKSAQSRPDRLALSDNVARLLELAEMHAKAGTSPETVLTITDLLAVYPPPGSRGEALLGKLGIAPDEFRAAFTAVDERKPGSGARQRATKRAIYDRVRVHADEPALADQLERKPFATVLAQHIKQARASEESKDSAFIIHLHGPWGSGKSSVLNFLETSLNEDDEARKGQKPKKKWLVVRFNAWRDQRRQPPWWSLITSIYAGARDVMAKDPANKGASKKLTRRWFKWRVRADFMPWLAAGLLAIIFLALLILGLTSSIGPMVSTIGGVVTLIGAGVVAARSLALGSQRAAQTYTELKNDPFQPITDLFADLVGTIEPNIAVFIDDLDRCDSGYVVELLEGIQTLMRGAPVTYVVAADRKWICSSFEQKYAGFSSAIGEPGRPLGYLFLDKMFQISAAVPQVSLDARSTYWVSLLSLSDTKQATERRKRVARSKARAKVAKKFSYEELQEVIDTPEARKDPVLLQALRSEAAIRLTSAEVAAEAEHRLHNYAELLDPNPRSMKRLVNAYGMHSATMILAGRSAAASAIARWTIMELRWPLLADFLATRPEYVDRLSTDLSGPDQRRVPEELRDLFGDKLVAEVAGPDSATDRLDADALRSILGAVQGDR